MDIMTIEQEEINILNQLSHPESVTGREYCKAVAKLLALNGQIFDIPYSIEDLSDKIYNTIRNR